jgi:3-dehydroquinate dehydratase/shikimate dehydrogenase
MRIAVSITAESLDEALRDMDEAEQAGADIIELRIDFMRNPNIERLLGHNGVPKIVTNRVYQEGGRFKGSEDERIAALRQAIALGAEYVDIELEYFQPLQRRDTKLIVSYHNFDETPRYLLDIYSKIAKKCPDIIKIATMANSCKDSLRMLNMVSNADRDVIGICMGQEGGITRLFGPLVGGYLTFASLNDEKAAAPGQISIYNLREMQKMLGVE